MINNLKSIKIKHICLFFIAYSHYFLHISKQELGGEYCRLNWYIENVTAIFHERSTASVSKKVNAGKVLNI